MWSTYFKQKLSQFVFKSKNGEKKNPLNQNSPKCEELEWNECKSVQWTIENRVANIRFKKKRRWSFLWKEMPNAFTALRACHPQYTSLEKLLIQFHIHWNILCAFFFFFGVFLCRSTCHFKRRALHRFVHCTHKSQRNALDFSIAHHACNQSVPSTSHVQTAAVQQTTKWSKTAMHRKQMGKEICC